MDTPADLFDFLTQFHRDRERGEFKPPEVYLRRFPNCKDSILEALAEQPDSTPPQQFQELERIGPYRVLEELGRGGQGVVYLAEDERIERQVALKILPTSALIFSSTRRQRLQREAEVVSRLNHPGICGIYDADLRGECAYIAMPVVPGSTLGAAISRLRADGNSGVEIPLIPQGREELLQLLEFFEACALALHVAHEAGVVHRDVKPGNLMVTPEGQGVWLDFGQARELDSDGLDLTRSGEVFGTPAYMSPEQIAGESGRVDARTDVWSLGVSLFEALTLERPFEGASTHTLLEAIRSERPKALRALRPDLPRDVEVVLATVMERDLTRRYSSALEFAQELGRIRRNEPIRARPLGPGLRLRRWARRSPVLFAMISGTLLALSLALLWTLYLLGREERALEHARGRHFGERAVALLDEDPSASLVLAIEAVERAPSYLTRSALYAALDRCYLSHELSGMGARRFRDIAVLADGVHVAAALSDGSARVYELASGREVWRVRAHEGDAVAVMGWGAEVVSAGQDGRVLQWNWTVAGASADVLFEGEEVRGMVACFECEAEWGALVIQGREDDLVRLSWDGVGPGRVLAGSCDHQSAESWKSSWGRDELAGLGVDGKVVDAARSPHGDRVAVALEGGVVELYELSSGALTARLEGYLNPVKVRWSLDGEFVVTHSKGLNARVWFATARPDVYRLRADSEAITHCAFSEDGERALTQSEDGTLRVWSTPSRPSAGAEVGTMLASSSGADSQAQTLREFRHAWPQPTRLHGEMKSVSAEWVSSRASEDGSLIVSFHDDGQLRLWSGDSGALNWASPLGEAEEGLGVVDFAFHPELIEVAVATSDHRVRFFDCANGDVSREALRTIVIRDVQWSPDGERLLVTGPKGRAAFHVEHLETGARMRTEVFHHGAITSGAFSPDGRLVLTSSMDGSIFVRDVVDGTPLSHLKGDGAPVLHAAFSRGPGALRVMGAFADGTARVWPVDPLPAAKARKPRELTEWEEAREKRLAWPLEYR